MTGHKEVLEWLNDIKRKDAKKCGIFYLGSQLAIGQTRLYAHVGTARRRVIDYIRGQIQWYNSSSKPTFTASSLVDYATQRATWEADAVRVVSDLEASGMLEFRKLGDRSPIFPYNVASISKEQADRFSKMLDAPDNEMVSLAMTMLESIQNKVKNEHNTDDTTATTATTAPGDRKND
jgi:hypothetical protein